LCWKEPASVVFGVPGDLVVWYAAGIQKYVARGWVETRPEWVEDGFGGHYLGSVAGIQRIEDVDRKKVINDCGFDGGRQSYQTVKDEIAADFLRSLGLLA